MIRIQLSGSEQSVILPQLQNAEDASIMNANANHKATVLSVHGMPITMAMDMVML